MKLQDFITGYPEFAKVAYDLIQSKMDEATLEVDPKVLGTRTDTAIGLLTAHKLALSPFGANARMHAEDGTTTYQKHFDALIRKTPAGFRVP